MSDEELIQVANEVRKGVVIGTHAAKSGHPGGSLGAADIITYLYFEEMNVDPADPRRADRDRFVLSKGHCAPALYAALAERGFFPKEDLESLRHVGCHLQGHPNMNDTPGVDMSTGSLGQGISAAVGMALAAKHWGDAYRTYCLLGDGEIEEGQVWEAAMFAGNQQLDNLCLIVDHNGLQIDGSIEEVNSAMPIADKFAAFKFHVIELADGNDMAQVRAAFEEARSQQQRMQRLLEHEAVSRQEAEAAATRYAQARSTYENTLDLLKDTRLKAPFAGVVERKYVDNFERVQAGQPILRLVNPVTATVQFTLPENGLSLLRDSSTRFTVEFDNYRGAAIPARLKEYVETSSDASGFPVSLTLENPDPARYRISPGMSCTITMLSADPVPDAVSLPVSAIFAPAEGGTYVWVVAGDDRVVRREVTLGELYGRDRVVVDSGVEPGERVVTAGVYQLRQGERVRILN